MTKKGSEQHNGNTLAAQAAFDREMVRVAAVLHRLDGIADDSFREERLITGLRLSFPSMTRDGYLAVMSSETAEGKFVAFNADPSPVTALIGIILRLENRSIKWKADQWK